MTQTIPDPLAPARLGPITLRNRVIKSATFEGATPDALVTDRLIDFHVRVGEGGVGMTTVAYLAVAPEGRTEYGQVYWRPEALDGLRRLTDAVTGRSRCSRRPTWPTASAADCGSTSRWPSRA